MKSILILFCSIIPFIAIGQEKMSLGDIEKVIEVGNISKSVLYNNAVQWASANEAGCNKKIEIQDSNNSSIVVKYEKLNTPRDKSLTKYMSYTFRFTVKIDCKDNKYRRIYATPSVLIGQDRNINLKKMTPDELMELQKELEAGIRISESYFKEILDWDLGKITEILFEKEKLITDYKQKLSNIVGNSRTEKKEKKLLEESLEKNYLESYILNESIIRWNVMIDKLNNNIDAIMNQNNDF